MFDMISEIIHINDNQCPRCGKLEESSLTIKGINVSECNKCGTMFVKGITLSIDESVEKEYLTQNN